MNKFNEIFLDLEQKILAKEYPPHSLLPSENQLIKIYGVSRETIRKALNLLTTEGYIQKNKEKVRSYWIGIASTFLFLD
jgi:GntR family transcriptional regulator, trehalose operon transcriptional repressor